MGGSEAAYRRLLAKFIDNQADAVSQLRAYLEAADQEAAVRTVHSLKGAAGALGIVELQALAADLEQSLGDSLAGVTAEDLTRLQAALDEVFGTLRAGLANGESAAPPASASAVIDSALLGRLNLLQQQLEDYDSEADDTLRDLLAGLGGSPTAEALAPLAALVSAYDMEAAAEQLAQLLPQLEEQCVD